MKNKVVLIAMLLCAATILTSCGNKLAGRYENDDGWVAVMTKDENCLVTGGGGYIKIKCLYETKGKDIHFSTLETKDSFTGGDSILLDEGTIDGDKMIIKGIEKPFIRKEKY